MLDVISYRMRFSLQLSKKEFNVWNKFCEKKVISLIRLRRLLIEKVNGKCCSLMDQESYVTGD